MSEPKAMLPALRFPEFRETGPWEEKPLAKLVSTVTPPKKLQTADYETSGNYPIIDQSQDFICGWTDDEAAIIQESFPLIVFGDHTCVLKRVDRPFAQGADGIKILDTTAEITVDFLFQFLHAVPLEMKGYRRHFSLLKEKKVFFPDVETGEQQKISDCLTSLDDLITAQGQKVAVLERHKKGLMQQLFPATGQTTPALRFPEFRDAGSWEEKRLGQLGHLVNGLTYSPDDVRDEGLLVLRSSNVQNGKIVLEDNVFVAPEVKGVNLSKPDDILICVRNGSKALIGKNALLPEGLPSCTHGAFMTIFRSKAAKFVFQLFQTAAFKSQVNGDLGATINSINGRNLINYRFYVPKPPEQQKIADCLASVDDLTRAETQKLDALERHKKGLMQQLFPNPDGGAA